MDNWNPVLYDRKDVQNLNPKKLSVDIILNVHSIVRIVYHTLKCASSSGRGGVESISCLILVVSSLSCRNTSFVFLAFFTTSLTEGTEPFDPKSCPGRRAKPSNMLPRRGCNCCHSKDVDNLPSAVKKVFSSCSNAIGCFEFDMIEFYLYI
jgi:hypothetical protein